MSDRNYGENDRTPRRDYGQAPDHDYAEQNYKTALGVMSEVRAGLVGAPPEAGLLYAAAERGITIAHNAIYSAQREIDRIVTDSDVYPQGRYERASAAFEKAAEVVKDGLSRAQLATRAMRPALEAAATPRFVGSDVEQQFVRDEIKDIVNRSSDPGGALATLARDPRYAGLAASQFGRSLLLGRGMDERTVERSYELVKAEAFAMTMQHGTPEQRKAAERVSVAETMQGAPLAAESACQMWLDEMAEKVRAAGLQAAKQAR